MPGDTEVRTTHLFRRTRRWALIGLLNFLPLPAWGQSAAWPEFPQPDPPPVSTSLPQRPPYLPARSTSVVDPRLMPETIGSAALSTRRLGPSLTMFPTPLPVRPPDPLPAASRNPSAPASVSSSTPASATRPGENSGLMPERAPKDFGQGWKQVVTHGPVERDRPAASLASPSTTRPRPAWGWHGYESYHRDSQESRSGGEWAKDLSAELAPFMKYAHRWRPSSVNTAYGAASSGYAATGTPIVPPVAYTTPAPAPERASTAPAASAVAPMYAVPQATVPFTPAVTVPVDGRGSPLPPASSSQGSNSTSMPTLATGAVAAVMPVPAVTVPVDSAGRPMIQQASYRAGEPASAAPKKYVVPLDDAAARNALPTQAQEKILATCAGKCRGLVVQSLGAGRLLIRFRAKDQLDAELVTNLLSSLPELAPYRVEFEVQIGQ